MHVRIRVRARDEDAFYFITWFLLLVGKTVETMLSRLEVTDNNDICTHSRVWVVGRLI